MDEEIFEEPVELVDFSEVEEVTSLDTPLTVEDIVDFINAREGLDADEDVELGLVYQENNISQYNSDTDTLTSLDIQSLNEMSELYLETNLVSVSVGSNDYFTFIEEPVLSYFAGIMANYPLNDYKAYHQKHYISSSQYYSYYDDYYYLFYDVSNSGDYIELYKANNSSSFVVSYGSGVVADASIMYGSFSGLADLRSGITYVESLSICCVVACACVLYVVSAIFKHIAG